jgi:hypothetical protein
MPRDRFWMRRNKSLPKSRPVASKLAALALPFFVDASFFRPLRVDAEMLL